MGLPLQQPAEYYQFGGGMNSQDADTALLDTEWSYLRNAEFIRRGAITTRKGGIRLTITPFNSGASWLLDFYYALDNGTSDRIVVSGNRISRFNNGTETVIASGFSTLNYWSAFQLSNRVILGNGIDGNRKWDGTNLYNLSIAAPIDNVPIFTTTVGAGGALAVGTFRYSYTYRNSTTLDESNPVEQNLIPLILNATTTAGNQTVTLSNFIASTDPQVDQIVVYRSQVDTVAPFANPLFEIGTKPNNAANFVDAGLADGTFELQFNNDPVPTSGIMTTFLNRGYYAINDTIRYSKPFIPGSSPTENNFRIGRDGQPITCLKNIGNNSLLIGKTRSIWILPGDPELGNVPINFTPSHGVINQRGADYLDNTVYFIDQSLRPHTLNPTDLANDQRRVNYIGNRLAPDFESIAKSGAQHIKTKSVDIEDRKLWLVSAPLRKTINSDTIFAFDLNGVGGTEPGAWSIWDELPAATLEVWPDSDGIPRLYRGDYYGHMWRQNITYGDGAQYNGTSTGANGASTLNDNTVLVLTGTATAGGVNTLTDATKTMTVNQYANRQIYISSGLGSGQFKRILSNTATTFTVDSNWAIVPNNTSVYQVGGFDMFSGLQAIPVIITGGRGKGQRRFIQSNTPTQITVFDPWDTVPDNTSTYAIGGISFEAWSNWKSLGFHDFIKRLWFLYFNFSKLGSYTITIALQFDFNTDISSTTYLPISVQQINTLWGFFLWGFGIWGARSSFQEKIQTEKLFHHVRFGIFHANAGQPVQLNGVGFHFQNKGRFTA